VKFQVTMLFTLEVSGTWIIYQCSIVSLHSLSLINHK